LYSWHAPDWSVPWHTTKLPIKDHSEGDLPDSSKSGLFGNFSLLATTATLIDLSDFSQYFLIGASAASNTVKATALVVQMFPRRGILHYN
jgi:hypothetical protein